tara:strand:+ start:123 stop:380 length:258 start_codon:yes stop_codon:yes gene_type:complete
MPKKKKTKTKVQKPMSSGTPNYKQKSQYDVEKEIKPDKIVEKDIFDGVSNKKGKVAKGSHRMPDGSIMKDSAMKKSKSKKKKTKY